ncbi:MAG: hypothetical protein ABJA71_15130, partial [Ginsengibacter sp.]
MKSTLKQIAEDSHQRENAANDAAKVEISNPATTDDRRKFLKKVAMGGISIAGLMSLSIEDTLAETTSKVQRLSKPSDLKIADMRYCQVDNRRPIIRLDTNQGIYGLGEVRDGADWRYALMLKSRLLGQNPCNVEMLFRLIKQFGGQ